MTSSSNSLPLLSAPQPACAVSQAVCKKLDFFNAKELLSFPSVVKWFSCPNPKCQSPASICMEMKQQYSKGDGLILSLACTNLETKRPGLRVKDMCRTWCFCVTCRKKFLRCTLSKHLSNQSHIKKFQASPYFRSAVVPVPETVTVSASSRAPLSPMEIEELTTGQSKADHDSMDLDAPPFQQPSAVLPNQKSNMKWLDIFSKLMPPPDGMLEFSYIFTGLEGMAKYFWAQHLVKNGGVNYLVDYAFQKCDYVGLHNTRLRDGQGLGITDAEAQWHFMSFIQYVSMSSEQRKRQARLVNCFYNILSKKQNSQNNKDLFFQKTYPLRFSEIHKFYGDVNSTTIWTNLPIPHVQNVGGIAYVNPFHVLMYLMAHGIPMDDFCVRSTDHETISNDSADGKRIFHISECLMARNMHKAVLGTSWYQQRKSKGDNNALLIYWSDWRDGFSPFSSKQNRKSVVLWTISFSAPKDNVNAITNTMPIAIGMKKNDSWSAVEHKFNRDVEYFQQGTHPITIYEGRTKKTMPCFVKQFCSLNDKIEKADRTATGSPSAHYHRCFGTSIYFELPRYKSKDIELLKKSQRGGNADDTLRSFGWSADYIEPEDRELNGSKFPACASCRQKNVAEIMAGLAGKKGLRKHACPDCANWTLTDETKDILKFDAPAKYPRIIFDGASVVPPVGREINPPPDKDDCQQLGLITIDYDFMKQAMRYAFANSRGNKAGKSWNKTTCMAYLRTVCVNTDAQESLYEAAKNTPPEAEIDYNDPSGVGSYKFPASWKGELPLKLYIETMMHLLFLGITKILFKRIRYDYAKTENAGNHRGANTYLGCFQNLILELSQFRLSWLICVPLSGSAKNEWKTGSWVSENWITYIRLFKISHAFFGTKGLEDERHGRNDLYRVIVSFQALVSRLMTHTGVDNIVIAEIELLVKEFLSAVYEFDIRCRHQVMNANASKKLNKKPRQTEAEIGLDEVEGQQTADKNTNDSAGTNTTSSDNVPTNNNGNAKKKSQGEGGGGGDDSKSSLPTWMISNYMSLLTLADIIRLLGPLVNWWDGGGKGERFIQEVKPHVQRGLRDQGKFFEKLMNRVYKTHCYKTIEEHLEMADQLRDHGDIAQVEDSASDDDDDDDSICSNTKDSQLDSGRDLLDDDDEEEMLEEIEKEREHEPAFSEREQDWTSPVSRKRHTKAKTIYVYLNELALQGAIDNVRPIAGMIAPDESGKPRMLAVFKKPAKQFGWKEISFDDTNGKVICCAWYAPINAVAFGMQCPQNKKGIHKKAHMSAVAVPYRFMADQNYRKSSLDDHREKYCVITDTWMERVEDGLYVKPALDKYLYPNIDSASDDSDSDENYGSFDEHESKEMYGTL